MTPEEFNGETEGLSFLQFLFLVMIKRQEGKTRSEDKKSKRRVGKPSQNI
jgi:hypothetical protein